MPLVIPRVVVEIGASEHIELTGAVAALVCYLARRSPRLAIPTCGFVRFRLRAGRLDLEVTESHPTVRYEELGE